MTGSTITDSGMVRVDAGRTLNLSGVSLTGGAVGNAGTVEITGLEQRHRDSFANTGAALIVDAGQTLTLRRDHHHRRHDHGPRHDRRDGLEFDPGCCADRRQLTVGTGQTLTLNNDTVTGSTITR